MNRNDLISQVNLLYYRKNQKMSQNHEKEIISLIDSSQSWEKQSESPTGQPEINHRPNTRSRSKNKKEDRLTRRKGSQRRTRGRSVKAKKEEVEEEDRLEGEIRQFYEVYFHQQKIESKVIKATKQALIHKLEEIVFEAVQMAILMNPRQSHLSSKHLLEFVANLNEKYHHKIVRTKLFQDLQKSIPGSLAQNQDEPKSPVQTEKKPLDKIPEISDE